MFAKCSGIFILFLFSATCVYAQPIGTVVGLSGEVKIQRRNEKEWRLVEFYFPIYSEDKIKTERDSSCEIILDTGEAFKVGNLSVVVVLSSGGKIVLRVPVGELLSGIKSFLTQKRKFEIRTPTAVISVRGTDFVIMVSTLTKPITEVAVFSGSVSVKSVDTKEEVTVAAKKQTFVEKNKSPAQPFALTEKFIKYYETQVLAFEKRVEETRKKLDEFIERRNKMIDDFYKKREKQIEKQFK